VPAPPDSDAARRFLEDHLGRDVGPVEWVGEGAWSRCFGFQDGARDLVIRFGRHVDDFENDRCAAGFRNARLPVPEVLEIGRAFGAWFAISTRGHGEPLEELPADAWREVLPSCLALLDAVREVDLSATTGWGGWDASGSAPFASWRDFLLAVDVDTPERRTHGWRARLAASPVGDAGFLAGHGRLSELTRELPVARHLVHADLINRNVLVAGGRVTAVFDWGCSFYGDFLYDVAWLEFWAPWHPGLAAVGIREAARRHYEAIGLDVPDFERRMLACAIHIGLDHLAYNAFTGDDRALAAVTDRLDPLVDAAA
jgi:hygromycin-B 4-O-kinase